MRAVAEREDPRIAAVDVELVGPVELTRVAVPRTEQQRDLLAFGDDLAVQLDIAVVVRVMYCVGLVKRSSSSTAGDISDGSAITASRWSGCDAKSRTPLAINLAVVS